jgi:hypothetical protein
MFEAVMVYVNYCLDLTAMSNPGAGRRAQVEQRFDLSHYYPGCFGTADFVCYFGSTKTLHVVDYKHGQGVPVEVEENEQLMYYGLGALHANKFPVKEIVLTIVQPRCYHKDGPIRSWRTTPERMIDFIGELVYDAKKTAEDNAPLVTGDHCRWCSASAVCPAQYDSNVKAAQAVFQPQALTSFNVVGALYDAKKLGDTLHILDRVEEWAKSVRAFAYEEAKAGRCPPGWKLVDKRAMRKWIDESAVIKEFNKYNIFEQTLMSPAKLEKILQPRDKERIGDFTISESSGQKLAPLDDDRPEFDKTIEAKKHFKQIKQEKT